MYDELIINEFMIFREKKECIFIFCYLIMIKILSNYNRFINYGVLLGNIFVDKNFVNVFWFNLEMMSDDIIV